MNRQNVQKKATLTKYYVTTNICDKTRTKRNNLKVTVNSTEAGG